MGITGCKPMSEEIINADGSRNYQANILLDNVKRLEEENKRLQAENEQLKNNIELMTKYNDENFDELLKCRKENEELKNKNYTLQGGWDFQIKMNEKLNKKLDNLLKYRKALEEIRTIAKSFDYWRNTLAGASEKINEIKDIVNEVLGVPND